MVNIGGVREDAFASLYRIFAALWLRNLSVLAFRVVDPHEGCLQSGNARVCYDLLVGCNLCTCSSGLECNGIRIEPSKTFDEMATFGSESNA